MKVIAYGHGKYVRGVLKSLRIPPFYVKKTDIPTFSSVAWLREENIPASLLPHLLDAVVALGDWGEQATLGLSDLYRAHHNLFLPPKDGSFKGRARYRFNPRNNYAIEVWEDGFVTIPEFAFTEGTTSADWGRFEAAIKAAMGWKSPKG